MELVRLYGLRWHAELNLRYLKDQMDLAQLDVRSAAMARKEWLAGLLAYNLIRAAQLCAALHQKLDPLALSFSSVRRRLEQWLKDFARTQTPLLDSWAKLLECMARCRLPRRTKRVPMSHAHSVTCAPIQTPLWKPCHRQETSQKICLQILVTLPEDGRSRWQRRSRNFRQKKCFTAFLARTTILPLY